MSRRTEAKPVSSVPSRFLQVCLFFVQWAEFDLFGDGEAELDRLGWRLPTTQLGPNFSSSLGDFRSPSLPPSVSAVLQPYIHSCTSAAERCERSYRWSFISFPLWDLWFEGRALGKASQSLKIMLPQEVRVLTVGSVLCLKLLRVGAE